MTAPKLANGRVDWEALTDADVVAEGDFRRTSLAPCPSCGHTLGVHALPARGRWYWACYAPVGDAPSRKDRPECGCTER